MIQAVVSEKETRKTFCNLVPGLDPVPIENLLTGRTGVGTPDVETIAGWVELKHLDDFPVRDHTIVRIPHFTDQQREWHERRFKAGELTWLVVQVKREWFVFTSEQLDDVGANWTANEWRKHAWAWFKTKPEPSQLQAKLLYGWVLHTCRKLQAANALLTNSL